MGVSMGAYVCFHRVLLKSDFEGRLLRLRFSHLESDSSWGAVFLDVDS
jgi:hypothetical protein